MTPWIALGVIVSVGLFIWLYVRHAKVVGGLLLVAWVASVAYVFIAPLVSEMDGAGFFERLGYSLLFTVLYVIGSAILAAMVGTVVDTPGRGRRY